MHHCNDDHITRGVGTSQNVWEATVCLMRMDVTIDTHHRSAHWAGRWWIAGHCRTMNVLVRSARPRLSLALAEELHDLAALFLAGHDLDERDAVPGEDDAGHAVCDVAQRLAVAQAWVEEGHGRVPAPRYVLHVGD